MSTTQADALKGASVTVWQREQPTVRLSDSEVSVSCDEAGWVALRIRREFPNTVDVLELRLDRENAEWLSDTLSTAASWLPLKGQQG